MYICITLQCFADALGALQAELLDAAAPLVRPGGGVLVYSTCSIEPEENQQQVLWQHALGSWCSPAREKTMLLADPASIRLRI